MTMDFTRFQRGANRRKIPVFGHIAKCFVIRQQGGGTTRTPMSNLTIAYALECSGRMSGHNPWTEGDSKRQKYQKHHVQPARTVAENGHIAAIIVPGPASGAYLRAKTRINGIAGWSSEIVFVTLSPTRYDACTATWHKAP